MWVSRVGTSHPSMWVWSQNQGGRWGPSSPYHGWALVTVLNTQHSLLTFINHTPTNPHHKLDSVVFSFSSQFPLRLRSHQVDSRSTWLTLKGYATREGMIRKRLYDLFTQTIPHFNHRTNTMSWVRQSWFCGRGHQVNVSESTCLEKESLAPDKLNPPHP